MMKQLIVYDLDGTLVDTLQDITNAANHMLSQLKKPPLTPDSVRRYVGRGVRQLVADCLQTNDSDRIAEGLRVYRAYYGRHLTDNSRLYPGAVELLAYFKGRQQAVITNKPNPYSRDLLAALGVAGYFVDIIGGDSVHPKKPDPGSLKALMAQTGVDAEETLFIGDSPIDVEAGRKAGVLTVAITHGLADLDELRQAAPDRLVDDFTELLGLVRHEQW